MFLTFRGKISSVCGLVILTFMFTFFHVFGVSDSYVLGLVLLRLGVSNSYVWWLVCYVWGLVILIFRG